MAGSTKKPASPDAPADGHVRGGGPGKGTWLFVLAVGSAAVYPWWSMRTPAFTAVDDAAVQVGELKDHLARSGRPARVVQGDLDGHPKVSQFDDIDASPSGYGRVACGPIAAAVALGGDDWPALLAEIVATAGDDYGARTGIQPGPYAAALRRTFGWWDVKARDRTTLGVLYDALASDRIVIVDLKVNDDRVLPSDQPPNYAHFARVLGMDVREGEIYLDNTLHGPSYWTVSLEDFMAAWRLPETSASVVLDAEGAEGVDRWAVFVDAGWP